MFFIILLVVGVMFNACDEHEDVIEIQKVPFGISAGNQELIKTAKIISSFINESDVRKELLTFSNSDWDKEVYISFKEIFNSESQRGSTILLRVFVK